MIKKFIVIKDGHSDEKCLKLHPELKPKWPTKKKNVAIAHKKMKRLKMSLLNWSVVQMLMRKLFAWV